MSKKYRALIIDDHNLVRAGLAMMIKTIQLGAEVIEVESAAEALDTLAKDNNFDIIFQDLTLQDSRGLRLTKTLVEDLLLADSICILSADQAPELIHTCENLKLRGFIPKSLSEEEMSRALEVIINGDRYFPANLMYTGDNESKTIELSSRQLEVLELLSKGLTNVEIAGMLNISPETVKNHIKKIFVLLSVSTRTEAVDEARSLGLI